jgi:hypothetical protein
MKEVEMKRLIRVASVVGVFCSSALFGQTFTLSVQNQQVSGTDFIFDIYMLRTGGTAIYLGNADFVLTFNHTNFTSPTFVKVSGGLTGEYTIATAPITANNRAILNVLQPGFGDQPEFEAKVQNISNSGDGTFIARVKITGISNPSGTAGLAWRTSEANKTIVNTLAPNDPWGSTDISDNGTYTDPADHSLPVQLTSFTAEAGAGFITLRWTTQSEVEVLGFNVYRSDGDSAQFGRINGAIIEGAGSSSSGGNYTYTDDRLGALGIYYYRLESVDIDGTRSLFGPIRVTVESRALPTEFELSQNFPNPFNPVTEIKYQLPETVKAVIRIYGLLGQEVRTLVDEEVEAGFHSVTWDGTDVRGDQLPSGIYIVTMQAGSFVTAQKMSLVR